MCFPITGLTGLTWFKPVLNRFNVVHHPRARIVFVIIENETLQRIENVGMIIFPRTRPRTVTRTGCVACEKINKYITS